MSEETSLPQPKIKFSWIIGVLAAFALFAAIGGYSRRMTETYTDYDEQRAQQRYATLAKLQHDEAKLINPVVLDADGKPQPTAEWVDQDKGIIRLPIEDAMAKEVIDLKAQAPAVAGDINPPAPPPAPAAGTSTNAAPAAPASTNAAPAAAKPKM